MYMQRSTFRSTSIFSTLTLLLALFSITASNARAQVVLSINMPAPYSPNLSDYRSDPSRVLVNMMNTTGNTLRIRISGYAENTNSSVRIDTRDDRPVPVITL